MYRIWQLFQPRSTLVGLFAFLLALAFVIHFVLVTSKDFNWLSSGGAGIEAPASSMSAMPPARTVN